MIKIAFIPLRAAPRPPIRYCPVDNKVLYITLVHLNIALQIMGVVSYVLYIGALHVLFMTQLKGAF